MAQFKLLEALEERKRILEKTVKRGVLPGDVDSYDLAEMKGRIKELKMILMLVRGE